MKIMIIDNYDSFTANLHHLITIVTKSSPQIISYGEIETINSSDYDLIVISPGPGKPEEYPNYNCLLDRNIPILGICLGMQIINSYYGGQTSKLIGCVHGRTEKITFSERTFAVARYHSLYVSDLAENLEVISLNSDNVPMAIGNRKRKILGYQFHPESFLTENGKFFINYATNYLSLA